LSSGCSRPRLGRRRAAVDRRPRDGVGASRAVSTGHPLPAILPGG
jgi:hypothetical protein